MYARTHTLRNKGRINGFKFHARQACVHAAANLRETVTRVKAANLLRRENCTVWEDAWAFRIFVTQRMATLHLKFLDVKSSPSG